MKEKIQSACLPRELIKRIEHFGSTAVRTATEPITCIWSRVILTTGNGCFSATIPRPQLRGPAPGKEERRWNTIDPGFEIVATDAAKKSKMISMYGAPMMPCVLETVKTRFDVYV